MYCTFWANFKYLSSSSEYSAYECFIFGINVVMAFIFLLFYLFKKKSVENRIIISIVPALILHFTIYFLSTMFVQYLFVFISDFILLLFFALRDVKIQVFNKKLMFNVVVFMFSIFLISIIIISNILENMQYEYESYVIDYADKIVDELKESGDSFLIYDDAILSERLLENGLMSDAHYIMCQKWHADLGLISVEDLKNDLERISPDIVIVSNYQYGHSSFYQDNLLSDYELVRADEVWKETDGVYGDELTYYIYRRAD
jgi:hypothetical protein